MKESLKQKQERVDKFIQLVNGGRTMGGVPLLPEIPPVEYKKVKLYPEKAEPVVFPEFDEAKCYEEFKKELESLRKSYAPFLENYARKPLDTRTEISLIDFDFRKETKQDSRDFNRVLKGKGKWEKVQIPHYVGPEGKWNCFYRTTFNIDKIKEGKIYNLDFEAVDYEADIYLNGRVVAHHVGFFAPFNAIITDNVIEGKNVLVVAIKNYNDTTAGLGGAGFGNKIYGATSLGYDDPDHGWHHCPAGAGIIAPVTLVISNNDRIVDLWCRPNIDDGTVTINTTFYNYGETEIRGEFGNKNCKLSVFYTVEGRNFKEEVVVDEEGEINVQTPTENFLKHTVKIPNFRLWKPTEPYLYQVTVTIKDEHGDVLDQKQTHFGMRKFHIDEESTPKGKFYLNNERIILRGANEMGHLPRCVMTNNDKQLIDDILIAKICNMNFYRMTQRPVFTKIYDYFDMLGMMCQTDFPMFGNTRPNLFGETLKQTSEMEKLTRNHPSVVIESFCNETIDTLCWNSGQYRVDRFELDKLFDAMRIVCLLENPDRVVKYCDGDYSVLENSYGIKEFHTYNLWYTSHTIPFGKMDRGWLPGVPTDWMLGCGEYGSDALDSYEVMHKYYPKSWLPKSDDEFWTPVDIAQAQCYGAHGYFFEEQTNIRDWIKASREWQRKATKLYVHALRRLCDRVQSTAIHLLIDAWPAGWTKTLVDVDRIPKPGYYAFKEANIPVRISIRQKKFVVYENDEFTAELFALNDTAKDTNAHITATVYYNGEVYQTYKVDTVAKSTSPNYVAEIALKLPKAGEVQVVAKMVANGVETFDRVEFSVRPQLVKAKKTPLVLSDSLECVKEVCSGKVDENIIFIDGEDYAQRKEEIEKRAFDGAKVFVNMQKPLNVLDDFINFRVHILADETSASNLVYNSDKSKYTKEFKTFDFQNFYSEKLDGVELTQWFSFYWEGSQDVLYTLVKKPGKQDRKRKSHKLICASKKHGKGEIILSTLTVLDGCIGKNPVLDKFFINVIEK